jgi:hypothetical protein
MSDQKKYEYQGQMYTTRELAEMAGLKFRTFSARLYDGWSIERIMSTPRMTRAQAGQKGARAMRSGYLSSTW